MNLKTLQTEQRAWSDHNFPGQRGRMDLNQPGVLPLLGAMEELGELAHAFLKNEQGIRGTSEEHERKQADAVGDVVVYLADFCSARGWDFATIVETVWDEVKQRDWQANPLKGVASC